MLPKPEGAGLGFARVGTKSKFAAGRGWRTKAAATSAAVLTVPGTMRKCRRFLPGLPSLSWRKMPVSRYARCDFTRAKACFRGEKDRPRFSPKTTGIALNLFCEESGLVL